MDVSISKLMEACVWLKKLFRTFSEHPLDDEFYIIKGIKLWLVWFIAISWSIQ